MVPAAVRRGFFSLVSAFTIDLNKGDWAARASLAPQLMRKKPFPFPAEAPWLRVRERPGAGRTRGREGRGCIIYSLFPPEGSVWAVFGLEDVSITFPDNGT